MSAPLNGRKQGEKKMNVKTNLRAGSQNQNQKQGSSTDSTSTQVESVNTVVISYIPPVSRCVGL
jgi:hypothetical protein